MYSASAWRWRRPVPRWNARYWDHARKWRNWLERLRGCADQRARSRRGAATHGGGEYAGIDAKGIADGADGHRDLGVEFPEEPRNAHCSVGSNARRANADERFLPSARTQGDRHDVSSRSDIGAAGAGGRFTGTRDRPGRVREHAQAVRR